MHRRERSHARPHLGGSRANGGKFIGEKETPQTGGDEMIDACIVWAAVVLILAAVTRGIGLWRIIPGKAEHHEVDTSRR